MFQLGIDGFTFDDLYQPAGLKRLHERFLSQLEKDDSALATSFAAYRAAPKSLKATDESALLIKVAPHVTRFVGALFGVAKELAQLGHELKADLSLFEFKREFVTRRVFKKGATDRPTAAEVPALEARMQLLFSLAFPSAGSDRESTVAHVVLTLMRIERHLTAPQKTADAALETEWARIQKALTSTAAGKDAFGSTLVGDDATQVRGLLTLADRWTYAKALFSHDFHGWSTITQPKPLVFDKLVELKAADANMPEAFEGPDQHLRRRDGFKLTDPRADRRTVMGEVDYCVICHEREKDSCSKGFKSKEAPPADTYKKNPLGIPLAGCPLEERISEAHALKGQGDSLAALAMVMIDNPMCAGTGHRICNDCMKACIFQKQEPVNIPQIETSMLTDVLKLPYGFEIYGFLTRWNPLNVKRPYALPYNGKNVLVVGLGPAGYTLSHYLLNEGFAVVGIDGLKLEPFPDELVGRNGKPVEPVKDFYKLAGALDERIAAGFGGVSEYGITVRWDKSFLTLIYLTLARRENLRTYGGVRFGGTITIDDAWQLGFDHIAIAAGAGKPTIVPMQNNLIRGIRAASDFLMALQLTGAFKKDSLTNLQVRLPAVVIGGGLTGIDTATELFAYYPLQVEKVFTRHQALAKQIGEKAIFTRMNDEELETYEEFLEHGKHIVAERARAKAAGEEPNFIPLVRKWGGVALCYRRGLTESPAYRLNHEEVTKALEEGIRFIERVSPVEAIPNPYGAVEAMKFERMHMVDGKLRGTGTFYELSARTVCVAAGTSPNITYERETKDGLKLDDDGAYFRGYEIVEGPDGWLLRESEPHEDIGRDAGFFTSYSKGGRFISFYGDNHPTYAGNVVKAMASAKDGYGQVVRLFEKDVRALDARDQASRDAARAKLFGRLDASLLATIETVQRLTPTIVEVIVKAPAAAEHFQPGQFYRLQNFERLAPMVHGTRLAMEGLALTGAWVDKKKGLLSTIVLEMGGSSRLCAALKKGEPIVLMGPTGTPTEIPRGETTLLLGGGLGNAVLFSIGQALKAAGCKVIYFAGYRKKEDSYKMDEVEAGTDQVVWSVDSGELIQPRRPQDATFRGNIVQAMLAHAKGELAVKPIAPFSTVDRIIAIGSDRMMAAVKEARHGVLHPFLKPDHEAIGSINSPMQCMMKEICAQCLQRHVDPVSGKESFVFSCYNQDQKLDHVDFGHLNMRLKANSVLEKQAAMWLDLLLKEAPETIRV